MGWNTGYTILEATVIGAYDLGKLDKELLSVLMEPYRGMDMDSGGITGLESEDGKSMEEIVLELWGLDVPPAPSVAYECDPDAWDAYTETLEAQMRVVTKHFGWG